MRRVFVERALEVCHRRLRIAASRDIRRRSGQDLPDPPLPARDAPKQPTSDRLVWRTGAHQRARGLTLQSLADGGPQIIDDRDRDQPVSETLATARQQPGRDEGIACRAQLRDRDCSHGGEHVRWSLGADHRKRASDLPLARSQLGEALSDRVAHARASARRPGWGPSMPRDRWRRSGGSAR
jgi:hypothetical protein